MRLDFCAVCGSRTSLHDHHWIARANGGGDEETNLLTLCPRHHGEMHGVKWDNKHSQLVKAGKARAIALYEDDSEIVAGYNSGKTIAQLSAEFGLSPNTTGRILRRAGVKLRGHRVSDEIRRKILAGYVPGMRSAELAAKFDVSDTTVQRVLNRAGIRLPPTCQKLSHAKVREILAIGRTRPMAEIAAEYGVSAALICRYLNGQLPLGFLRHDNPSR